MQRAPILTRIHRNELHVGELYVTRPWMRVILDLSKFDSERKTEIQEEEYRAFLGETGERVPRESAIAWRDELWDFWRSDERKAIYVFKEHKGKRFVQKTFLVHDLWPSGEETQDLTSGQIIRRQLALPEKKAAELARLSAMVVEERYFAEVWSKILGRGNYWGRLQSSVDDADSFRYSRWKRIDTLDEMSRVISTGRKESEDCVEGVYMGSGRSISLGTLFCVQAGDDGKRWIVIKKNKVIDDAVPLSEINEQRGLGEFVERVRAIPVPDVFGLSRGTDRAWLAHR